MKLTGRWHRAYDLGHTVEESGPLEKHATGAFEPHAVQRAVLTGKATTYGSVEPMKSIESIKLADVKEVYDGAEGNLWELLMGEQIHIGGFKSSIELADRANIGVGQRGVDLCCCNGAGMRFLVRFRDVASMIGVDATTTVVERGRARCEEEGLADRIEFKLADVCASGLPDGQADFVWAEDAWCYVEDKAKLVAEAARVVKPGGTIAFTDWVEGPAGLSDEEAGAFLQGMKFPGVQDIEGYRSLLESNGCDVAVAEDTGRFAPYVDLYLQMIDMQLMYDALKILAFDTEQLGSVASGFQFFGELAQAGKIAQGRFIARKR
jgi:SAM-dependent methyltransferase